MTGKTVTISGFANGGYGLSTINGKVVFVRYALPFEIVEVNITQEKRDYCVAQVKRVLKPSKYRTEPQCVYYKNCGGCDLQHAEYTYQLRLKQEAFANTIKRIAGISLSDIPPIVPSKKQWHYRKRVRFKCKKGRWGFYKRESNNFVQIDQCKIADERINAYIIKRKCKKDGFICVDDYGHINNDEMLLNINLEKPLFFRSGAFTQVNRDINLKIIDDLISIIEYINPTRVVEFFSGIGNFTVPLALKGIRILALELSNRAVSSLKKNVRLFNLDNVTVEKKDLSKPFKIKGIFDLAILDPPRDGANTVIHWLKNKRLKNVIYISCNPATFARDIKNLSERYVIEMVKLYDMFPQTHHIETMALLKLNE